MKLTDAQAAAYNVVLAVLRGGRGLFFERPDSSLPWAGSDEIRLDDAVPQFGFVGTQYHAGGLLVVGINPGLGDRYARNAIDRRMMPFLHRLIVEPTEASYRDASAAQEGEFRELARSLFPILVQLGLTPASLAYTNALPYRAGDGRSGSAFPNIGRKRAAARFWLKPLISALNPSCVIAYGRTASDVLMLAGVSAPIITFNRSQNGRDRTIANANFSSQLTAFLGATR